MGVRARVYIRRYDPPVKPVVVDDTRAANLKFGEMTAEHGRRARRRRRKMQRGSHPRNALIRFW